jgi:hypothetical protein
MEAEAGTFKIGGGDSGLHNKPAGCGASEACALGPWQQRRKEEVRQIKVFDVTAVKTSKFAFLML